MKNCFLFGIKLISIWIYLNKPILNLHRTIIFLTFALFHNFLSGTIDIYSNGTGKEIANV